MGFHALEQLQGALDIELEEHAPEVGFYRVDADAQVAGDLFVGMAQGPRLDHFQLARAGVRWVAVHHLLLDGSGIRKF